MLETLVQSVLEIGYIGFFFYMVIVGTFIPLPTQLLLLPAGYLISIGKLDFTMVAIITAAGTTTGAFINYIFAKKIIANVFEKKKRASFSLHRGFFQTLRQSSCSFSSSYS